MSQFSEGDAAVNRLTAATTAFEKVLTEPEGVLVPMPLGQPQPSLSERLKRALDAVTVQPAQAAAQATAAAQQASQSALAAAQSAADAASSAAATGYVDAPFPDVWAPLSDSLQLLAGSAPADTLTISGTSYPLKTKSVSFSRASTATYIDKSGVLQTAAINEPRFEKEGLLIEEQRTNYYLNSNDPSKWATSGVNKIQQADGNTQAITGIMTLTADSGEINILANSSPVSLSAGGVVSVSCRVKGTDGRLRIRIANSSTLVADCTLDLVNGVTTTGSGIVITKSSIDGDGYYNFSCTFTAATAESYYFQIRVLSRTGQTVIPAGAEIRLQMPQLETGIGSTSYIPTTTTTVTRAADVCTLQRSGNENYFGPFAYSAEVQTLGPMGSDTSTSARRGIISFYPSNTEYVMSYIDSSTIGVGTSRSMYGSSSYSQSRNRLDDSLIHNVVFSTDLSKNKLSLDGDIVEIATSPRPTPGAPSPQMADKILIGWGAGATAPGQRMLNGHIRNLRIWHRALSDNQIKGIR